jgi:hypothetical protein
MSTTNSQSPMNVCVYTSISPTHALGDIQQHAAMSWIKAGIPYTTMNSYGEQAVVPEGARAIVTNQDGRDLYGKPYIFIDDMLELADRDEVDVAIITNSDIELIGDITAHLEAAKYHMVISRRIEYTTSPKDGKVYPYGIDLFMIPRRMLKFWPRSQFVLGQTWWDYWLPYWAILKKERVFMVQRPAIAHKAHKIQHSPEQWHRQTALFQFLTSYKPLTAAQPTGLAIHRAIEAGVKKL